MNPHFRKGNKAKHGSGHLWVLADLDDLDQDDGMTIKVTYSKKISTNFNALKNFIRKIDLQYFFTNFHEWICLCSKSSNSTKSLCLVDTITYL